MGFWIGDNPIVEEYILGSCRDSRRIADIVFKDDVGQQKLQFHLTQ